MSRAVDVKPSPEGVPGAVTDPASVAGESSPSPAPDGAAINGYLARPPTRTARAGPSRR